MKKENTKELTAMNSDRIKEIQDTTVFPESLSVKQALLQVWNECEQQANKEIERLKGKTNYDEVEVIKQQLKAKDEMLENFLTRFKDAIIYGFTITEYNELLNQYNQSK